MTQWLTTAEVLARTKRSAATLYRHIAAGLLPEPVAPGRWSEKAIDSALEGLPDVSNDNETDQWAVDSDAIRESVAAETRRHREARRRNV